MKKIWLWILLLLLLILIIFCVWCKKDDIKVAQSSLLNAENKSTLGVENKKQNINYTITQKENHLELNGNFKNILQQNKLVEVCKKESSTLEIKNTSVNNTLLSDEALDVTEKILPHFIANYKNGKITYNDGILNVSGDVTDYSVKNKMQNFLNETIVQTQENSTVVKAKAPTFKIEKKENSFDFDGVFGKKENIDSITTLLPKGAKVIAKDDNHRIDNGVVVLVKDILPTFVSKYKQGEIVYDNEILTIAGDINSQSDLDEISKTLSAHGKIKTINKTVIDPKVLEKQKAEALAKEKERQEALSRANKKAEALAKKIAQEKEKAEAEALEKAKQEALAKQEQEAINIANAEKAATAAAALEKSKQEELDKQKNDSANGVNPESEKAKAEALALEKAKQEELDKQKQEAINRANTETEEEKEKTEALEKAKEEALEKQRKEADKIVKAEIKENIASLFKLDTIEFQTGKTLLTNKSKKTVEKLAQVLKKAPSVIVEIAGHTDSDGAEEFNKRLSQTRVDVVKAKLLSHGVLAKSIVAKGYGESKPLAPNTSKENKQRNRRVEINILGE